jgi:hypothetical protein
LNKKAVDLQMLKFGKIIDIDAMQASAISPQAEQLKVPLVAHSPATKEFILMYHVRVCLLGRAAQG